MGVRSGERGGQAQSSCPESCCQDSCAPDVQNWEEHRRVETTCSRARVEAHSPIKVEAFLKENRRTAFHRDDPVLHIVRLRSHLQFRPKR
jgi:hypothetical protein